MIRRKLWKHVLVYIKKVRLFTRSLVYTSFRESGCPVCTFCKLFLKKILTFTKRRFRNYSAITGTYLCVGSAGRTFTNELNETILFYSYNNKEMVRSLSEDLRWRVVYLHRDGFSKLLFIHESQYGKQDSTPISTLELCQESFQRNAGTSKDIP